MPKIHVDNETYELLLKLKGRALMEGKRLTMAEIVKEALLKYVGRENSIDPEELRYNYLAKYEAEGLIEIEVDNDKMIVKPTKYLGSSFKEINEIIKKAGGRYEDGSWTIKLK